MENYSLQLMLFKQFVLQMERYLALPPHAVGVYTVCELSFIAGMELSPLLNLPRSINSNRTRISDRN